jgi:hypothetical protein
MSTLTNVSKSLLSGEFSIIIDKEGPELISFTLPNEAALGLAKSILSLDGKWKVEEVES